VKQEIEEKGKSFETKEITPRTKPSCMVAIVARRLKKKKQEKGISKTEFVA